MREERPIKIAERDNYITQITILRERNAKLRLRMKELNAYMLKL